MSNFEIFYHINWFPLVYLLEGVVLQETNDGTCAEQALDDEQSLIYECILGSNGEVALWDCNTQRMQFNSVYVCDARIIGRQTLSHNADHFSASDFEQFIEHY